MSRLGSMAGVIAGLIGFGSSAALLLPLGLTVSLADSDRRIGLVGEPTPGLPTCDEFYDKWDVPGAPPGILAMAGFSREVFAAKDCIDKNNVPKACEHWSKLLVVLDKIGPPLNDNRGDIEELMRQHHCEAATNSKPAADSKPTAKVTPGPESAPAKPAQEAGPSPAPDPDPEPGPAPAE
jgi:hypothetical protein